MLDYCLDYWYYCLLILNILTRLMSYLSYSLKIGKLIGHFWCAGQKCTVRSDQIKRSWNSPLNFKFLEPLCFISDEPLSIDPDRPIQALKILQVYSRPSTFKLQDQVHSLWAYLYQKDIPKLCSQVQDFDHLANPILPKLNLSLNSYLRYLQPRHKFGIPESPTEFRFLSQFNI